MDEMPVLPITAPAVDPDAEFRASHERHRAEVAGKALQLLKINGGQESSAFCHLLENYRRHTGVFPLPVEQLPCLNCPKRTEDE